MGGTLTSMWHPGKQTCLALALAAAICPARDLTWTRLRTDYFTSQANESIPNSALARHHLTVAAEFPGAGDK
ncbi:hypothetical protein CSOJ01_00179 [Colletotrichum sojae]|uniref:Uncharacterized protein n=1 Tax=Colletotrichum sojae TaxID=2175907 RepID=A0A8H6JZI8_9PEZI|nr:hypothetical protein CSOJ01_00179 [Colletotrichum sojae]